MKVVPIGSPVELPAPPGAEEAKAQPYMINVEHPHGVQTLWSLEVSLVYAGAADSEEDAKERTAELTERLREILPQMLPPGG